MATSGSVDYSVTGTDIITEALELLGVLGEGESPTTAQSTSMLRTLNMMVKAWQAEGTNLFAIDKTYLVPAKDTNNYTLSSSGDHFTSTLVTTTTSATSASGANTLTVTSIANMSDADNIGVELDDGTIQWTTINGAPTGSIVTLTANLTDDVNSSAAVYVYTAKTNRPMKLLKVMLSEIGGNDIPVDVITLDEYAMLPTKSSDGAINSVYYDPQVASPTLFVWPESNNPAQYLTIWVQRTIEDFDAAANDADFPQEWFMALALNLALLASSKYGIPAGQANRLAAMATYYKELAEAYDTEDVIYLQPDPNWGSK